MVVGGSDTVAVGTSIDNKGNMNQNQNQQKQQQQNQLSSTSNVGGGLFGAPQSVGQQPHNMPQSVAGGQFPLVHPLGPSLNPSIIDNNDSHNLIPQHLQAATTVMSLNGTPGYPPALIPSLHQTHLPLPPTTTTTTLNIGLPVAPPPPPPPPTPIYTVQDRPLQQPVYNGVNPAYPGLRVLNTNPPIFCVDQFLSPQECNFLITNAQDAFGPAPVVGKGAGEVSPSRTSSTCYLDRQDIPDLLRKIHLLTGKPYEHCELPQVGRYYPTQQYLQHYDAFDISTEDGRRFASNGGQRTITVLIYLNTVHNGGATHFPALNLSVQPVQGMALVFFPATIDGLLDKMALHAALPAIDTKYVSQVWIRQTNYSGTPSKRLPSTMGVPFGQEHLFPSNQHGGAQQNGPPTAPTSFAL